MVKTIITVDVNKAPNDQPTPLHNRWHPDIPAVSQVKPGDTFRLECLDWTGGQIKDNDDAADVRDSVLTKVHYLSGPVAVEGAEPGDLLVVDIVDMGPLPNSQWGYTGIFAKKNGGSFLTDHFPDAYKAIWHFDGDYAISRHLPGIRVKSLVHAGVMGNAPSHELLQVWNKREKELFDSNPTRVPPLCNLPDPKDALLGLTKPADAQRIAKEAARTVPPREHGGNGDIKNLAKGSRIFFPVYIKGANFSTGDMHFTQGDGEIAFCGAIEMAGWMTLRVDLIKDGVRKYGIVNPIFTQPDVEAEMYKQYLVFEGISVDEQGKQYYLDANISYRRACLNAIEYLKKFGYTGEQAYLLLSCAIAEGRISAIVDIPNACCTVSLPTDIFDFDITPSKDGPVFASRGKAAPSAK